MLQQVETFVKVEHSTGYIVYHLFSFQSVCQPQSVLLLIVNDFVSFLYAVHLTRMLTCTDFVFGFLFYWYSIIRCAGCGGEQ